MSIHLGEFLNKLKVLENPDDRRKLYFKYASPMLCRFYEIVQKEPEFRSVVKNRPILFEDYPYGCTRTNLFRELPRLKNFIVGKDSDYIPDSKIIELWDKLLLSLHRDESVVVSQLANKSFKLPNAFPGEVDWVVQHLRLKS